MVQVSICIPTYNRPDYLKEAIESALNVRDYECQVIVGDNASDADVKALIQGFDDKRLEFYRHEKNLGMIGNWNRCLELAQGEYVLLLSDDDRLLPEGLNVLVSALNDYPSASMAIGSVVLIDGNGKFVRVQSDGEEGLLFESGSAFYERYLTGKIPIELCGTLFRKSAYEKAGIFDAEMPHLADMDMWLRMALFSDVVLVRQNVGEYRVHKDSGKEQQRLSGQIGICNYKMFKKQEELVRKNRLLPPERLKKVFAQGRGNCFGMYIAVGLSCLKQGNMEYARNNFAMSFKLSPTLKGKAYAMALFSLTYAAPSSYAALSQLKKTFCKS